MTAYAMALMADDHIQAEVNPNDDWGTHGTRLADASEWNPAQLWRCALLADRFGDPALGSLLVDLDSGHGQFLGSPIASTRWELGSLVGLEGSPHGVARA